MIQLMWTGKSVMYLHFKDYKSKSKYVLEALGIQSIQKKATINHECAAGRYGLSKKQLEKVLKFKQEIINPRCIIVL